MRAKGSLISNIILSTDLYCTSTVWRYSLFDFGVQWSG